MRYLKRKFDTWLSLWRGDSNRKPLLVKGARQVGKTESIRHFATANYTNVIEINFVLQPEFKQVVSDGYKATNVIRRMSALDPTLRFIPGQTLLFFDEIQEFPDIATSFKDFKSDGRYDVISSGSMLGVHYKQIASIPVGFKTDYDLTSLDFEEYLWACGYGADFVDDLFAHLAERRPFDAMTLDLMNRRFLDYCALGGMPEILRNFFDKGTFEGSSALQRELFHAYRDDVRKYAEGVDQTRILNVLDHVAQQLAKENKKFQISKVAKDARFKDYRGCVEWLKDAGVINLCHAMSFPELPIGGNQDEGKFKIYMADSGLLLGQLDDESQRDFRANHNLGTYKGGLYENIVGEALSKSGAPLVYYKREDSTLEMDFFLRDAEHLVPVEVKAGSSKAKSIRNLIDSDHYPDIKWGIKLVNGNVGFMNGILTLPQWTAFLLKRLLANAGVVILAAIFAFSAAAQTVEPLNRSTVEPLTDKPTNRQTDKPTSAVYRRVIERVASLDPVEDASVYAARCVALTYETLLEYDYEARPYRLKPCLATAMPAVSDDGLVYTFTIDTNAYFTVDACFGAARTRPVTAADFVYSLKRLADAKVHSSGYWLLDGRVEGIGDFHETSKSSEPTDYDRDVPGLRVLSDDTLQIRLSAPSPVFLWMLAMPYTAAIPREAVDFYGDRFREHPVGTGPYALAEWRRNYKMTYRRNDGWRGWRDAGEGTFGRIVFPLIDDPSTQWLAFLAGELDLQGEVPRDNWDQVVMADGTLNPDLAARGLVLDTVPTLQVAYIGINMDDPVLGTNRFLRQALNAAFDAARWEAYYRGRAMASDGPVPPQVAGATTNALPYGRGAEVAARLLEKAGYPGGRDPATGRRLRLTLDLGKTTQDMRESTELIVAFMDRCGIELVPEYSSWPTFLQKVSQRRSQLFRIAWVGDYPDAENFLQLFYGPNASPGPNRCNYSNPEFDRIFREATSTTDEARRLELYGKLQDIVREDSPWIFMSFATSASLHHDTLLNYRPHDFPYGMEKHLRKR